MMWICAVPYGKIKPDLHRLLFWYADATGEANLTGAPWLNLVMRHDPVRLSVRGQMVINKDKVGLCV